MHTAGLIDITDLSRPVLSRGQEIARAQAEANPVTLSVDAILTAARAETGLDDFGAEDFVGRLQVMIEAIDEDAEIHEMRRADLLRMWSRFAKYRLRVEDLVKRHPEILQIEMRDPIIVTGLPRSGTTHLVSVLSADKRLRSLPWWEAIAPIPTDADSPTEVDLNPRWRRAQAGWELYDRLLPHMAAMHEFSTDHISEDIELQGLDFSSYLLEWLAYVPRWRDYYLSHDQTSTYAYLRKVMQVLSFLSGPKRWVIKCPQHMEQLRVLWKTFPQGTFVLTHRDPVASIQSAITATCYYDRLHRKSVNLPQRADYWIDRYKKLLTRCVEQRSALPASQSIDLYYGVWTKNPDDALDEIYKCAGLPLTQETRQLLHQYVVDHPEGAHGKVVYNLRRDFGISAAELRQEFRFYLDRFPVKAEVRLD